MERLATKRYHRLVRKRRIRKKITGSAARPRITAYRSNRYLSIQAINDEQGATIASVANIGGGASEQGNIQATKKVKKNYANCEQALQLGEQLGAALIKQKITTSVFDCNGYRYHGAIKAVAEGVRKAGVNI